MRKSSFWLVYVLLLVAQLVLCNYANFTPYVCVTILPVMVLFLPIRVKPVGAMLIAFATGLCVDFLSDGLLGVNAIALIPVAFLRNYIIELVFGRELFIRREDFSVRLHGFSKVFVSTLIVTAIFLAIYVWVEAAGARSFQFNLLRFIYSLAASMVVSILCFQSLAAHSA